MRIDLPDGQWAELRDRITHGDAKTLKAAWRTARQNDDQALIVGFDTLLMQTYVTAWHVLAIDGKEMPLEPAAFDLLPEETADPIAEAAANQWAGAQVPNVPTPPSSDDSPSGTE